MDAKPQRETPNDPSVKRALLASILSILVIVAGAASYVALLDVPSIRKYGTPNLLLMIAGCAIAVRAATMRPRWPGTLASIVALGTTALFVSSTYLFFGVPAPQQARIDALRAVDADAPTFTLPDQDGNSVTLADYWGKGPVLLVFYRGHW